MMTVSFFDFDETLVARYTVEASTDEEAVRLAGEEYKLTPNAEFKPLCEMPAICVQRR